MIIIRLSQVFAEIVTCPHGRAYEYFTEAINSTEKCIFWGHKASVSSVVKTVANTVSQGVLTKLTALSPTCSREDCTPLGLRTKLSSLRGSYIVTTKGRPPFCIFEEGVAPETSQDKKTSSILQKIIPSWL